jgi:uracil-DNA glycosylase family 4
MAADLNNSSMSAGASEAELVGILRWYADMGIDLAVGDLPRDHFAEAKEKAAQAPSPEAPEAGAVPRGPRIAPGLGREPTPLPIRAATPEAAVPPDEALIAARAAAVAASSMEALTEALSGFDGCLLKRTASHLVFAEGPSDARVLFVGGVPSAEDDREGRVLAGSSGLLFDRMLKSIGLTRAQVQFVNCVPWRPAGGKAPTVPEIAICAPFLQRAVELSGAPIIVTLGSLPTQQITGTRDPITRARGKWIEIDVKGSQKRPVMAMFDPDYLRKSPTTKKHAWADLRALKKKLIELGLA